MPQAVVEWKGVLFVAKLRDAAKDALRATALSGIADIQESMRTTETMPSKSAKTGRVSVPGSPPAIQTGNLESSIDMDDSNIEDLEVFVGVTSLAPYGVYLEHGTKRMLPRPFIAPARDKMQEELEAAVQAKMKEVVR